MILTETLAKRIEKKPIRNYSPGPIMAFLKGRREGIRFVKDLIEYYDKKHLLGVILQLDFVKAFESAERIALFDTLRKFNYGEDFIQWIECCYNNISSCVMNNGYSMGWFKLQRGIRQGCALSCYLFIS